MWMCVHVHMYVYMCAHVCVCMHVFMCMCVRICMQNACRSQMSFLRYLAWNSPSSLGWLVNEHKESPSLCLPRNENFKSLTTHYAQLPLTTSRN